ncbi:MAG: hypothetical protein NZ853_02080 [Leptospiraceae bacterium]|nr:hypothetical protein [Leptospiraceae bacterium]MDW7975986.1 C1 family peptidase [Leptospiraceae bacterium]
MRFYKIIISVLLIFVYIENQVSQESFDPASVQSPTCNPKELKCGFLPVPQEVEESIPVAESVYISHRGLPKQVDMSNQLPPIMHQGRQNSCIGFAVGYYTKSFYEYKENQWQYDPPITGGSGEKVFSPSFIYNQINGGKDHGAYFVDALNLVIQKGVSPWKYMPYDEKDYLSKPSEMAIREARKYKARSYRLIPFDQLEAIKSELSRGNLIIFGITVDDRFYKLKNPAIYDQQGGRSYGGHAMVLVGYNDELRSPNGHVGAFKLVNSWGSSWGDKGYGWITYKMWLLLRPQAYVLYDSYRLQNITSPEEEGQIIENPRMVQVSQGEFPDKILLKWKRVPHALAYGILRLDPNADNYRQIAYVDKPYYEDYQIVPGIAYQYRVYSISDNQTSDINQSEVLTGYADVKQEKKLSLKISNVHVEIKSNQILIKWDDFPNASSYQIQKWDEKNKQWQKETITTKANSFIERKFQKNQRLIYRVRALVNQSFTEWSEPIEVSIPGESFPPQAPKITQVSKGTYRDRIEVEWTPIIGAEEYAVFRFDSKENQWDGPYITKESKFIDKSDKILTGEQFIYVVSAINSAGNSPYSNYEVGFTNPNINRTGEVLPSPKNLKIQTNGKRIRIEWEHVNNAQSYYIFRKSIKEDEYQFLKEIHHPSNYFEEELLILSPHDEEPQIFFYVVRSKSELGKESDNSEPVVAIWNPQLPIIKPRSIGNVGIKNFVGTWKGKSWDGKESIQEYQLQISDQENKLVVELITSKSMKEELYETNYVPNSTIVKFRDFDLEFKKDFDLLFFRGKEKFQNQVVVMSKSQ